MRIHCLQHVPFEGPGVIEEYANKKGWEFTFTRFFEENKLPPIYDIDLLLIMGGPMGVYDQDEYPWLEDEKKYIKSAIDDGKLVLGICLGSQLIANVLGEKIYRNPYKEIGFYPLKFNPNSVYNGPFKNFPDSSMAFHWHGDTYDLPAGCKHIASSDACVYQAFQYGENVIGLQFHLEVTFESLSRMINHGRDELFASEYVQSEDEILSFTSYIETCNVLMDLLLENWLVESSIPTNGHAFKNDKGRPFRKE